MPAPFSMPQYGELTPEIRERLEKFREEHAGDPIGGVGTQRALRGRQRVRSGR